MDYQEGSTVKAFHPHTLGVIYTGRVVKIGRKWVAVDFGLFGPCKVAPRDIVETVSFLEQPTEAI